MLNSIGRSLGRIDAEEDDEEMGEDDEEDDVGVADIEHGWLDQAGAMTDLFSHDSSDHRFISTPLFLSMLFSLYIYVCIYIFLSHSLPLSFPLSFSLSLSFLSSFIVSSVLFPSYFFLRRYIMPK